MSVRKNDIVKGIIQDFNNEGLGVLKTEDGLVVFVLNALPGEEVEAVIINAKSKFAIAKPLLFKNQSENRVTPPCPHFLSCGGCDLMHLSHSQQKLFKQNKVKNVFKQIAGIDLEVQPLISLNQTRYRNKIALPVQDQKIGLFRKNSHNLITVKDCLITEEWNKQLIEIINKYMEESKISSFDEQTNSGILKHIVARYINDSILVTLVVTTDKIPKQKLLIDLLKSSFNNFGLNLNINNLNNNVILSNNWKHLFGLKELTSFEEGIIYPVSNASFYQVNNEIKTAIYHKVLELIPSNHIVIDAYSGAGLLSGIISKKAKKCFGVEIIPQATKNANELKEKNNLTNLENLNGDCVEIIPKLVKKLKNEKLIITLDPPRKGCDKKVLEAITASKPEKIIYISCDPATLARDAKLIISNGYTIDLVQPYDMFPNTAHVETLAVFCPSVKY